MPPLTALIAKFVLSKCLNITVLKVQMRTQKCISAAGELIFMITDMFVIGICERQLFSLARKSQLFAGLIILVLHGQRTNERL